MARERESQLVVLFGKHRRLLAHHRLDLAVDARALDMLDAGLDAQLLVLDVHRQRRAGAQRLALEGDVVSQPRAWNDGDLDASVRRLQVLRTIGRVRTRT